tara:strand:+ start:72320 stop:73030 length:711 start_codon:yes stop_codon:yes gene_type:complete
MGFLDLSTSGIILDAVLTDKGRELLADGIGRFSIAKFAFSDEEVDYGIIESFGRTVGKEKIEKNTPVLEASTSGNLAQRYRLRSINNDALSLLPTVTVTSGLTLEVVSLTRTTLGGGVTSKSITISQAMIEGVTIDPDLTDFSYRVTIDNLFLTIRGRVPDSVDTNNVAVYTIPANASITSQNLSSVTFTIVAKSISDRIFTTYSSLIGTTSTVTRNIGVSGVNSGAFTNFTTQIS